MTPPNTPKDYHLRLFLGFIRHIKQVKGISNYKLLKECNIHGSYVQNIITRLKGGNIYTPNISLPMVVHISQVHKVPFEMSIYIQWVEAGIIDKEFNLVPVPSADSATIQ